MPDADAPSPLSGREIVLGVCGSIACYKAADLTSKLAQAGCRVTVVMTAAAKRFVTPLTFESLSARKVLHDAWDLTDAADPQHIALTERADLLLIAPATTDLLGKAANGLCDDLLTNLISAAACPIWFAPAMNHRMWDNPATQRNVQRLRDDGHTFVGPEAGWLACRNVGAGRMSEPLTILQRLAAHFAEKTPQ